MKDIVCFSSTRWDFLWQRPQQIMTRLAERNRVLYVDHFISVGEGCNVYFSYRDRFRRVSDNLYIFSPRYISRTQLFDSLKHIYDQLGITRPVLWVYYPTAALAPYKMHYSLLCYDCVDDFAQFSWTPKSFAAREQKFMQQCDLVFVTSSRLKRLKEKYAKEVHLVPNGADVKHFSRALEKDLPVPEEIRNLKKPVIGFVGAVHEWVDVKLIREICVQRPGWSLVLVGPVGREGAAYFSGLKNLHITGKREYSELPAILKGFDACIIPFKINSLTESVNPIKLYEYLAAGKPVVSTPIPEVLQYSEVVKTASTPPRFIQALEEALEGNNPGLVERRLMIARENSWDKRVSVLEQLVERKLSKIQS